MKRRRTYISETHREKDKTLTREVRLFGDPLTPYLYFYGASPLTRFPTKDNV